ncbi:MAG TPA: SCO family protein [Candidatus Acidoferrales bacterium]|nr:SCO family protein [Candidatus Acidoferrales bacterium]
MCSPALANDSKLHGVILAVQAKQGQVIVRHDAFHGMPAMTMPFKVVPASQTDSLSAGKTVDATVDTSTEPWTLKNIRVAGDTDLTNATMFRRVDVLQLGDRVPTTTAFVDQAGKPFTFAQLAGQNVVMAFIYTRCQDPRMCPLISAKFNQLQKRIDYRTHLVEVTLDPSYDRPAVLKRYAAQFQADPSKWTFLTGDSNTVLDFAAKFGVTALPDPRVGIIHSEDTVIIGHDGRIADTVTTTSWQPNEVVAEIDAQDKLLSNPLARFDLMLSRTASAICGNAVGGFSGLRDLGLVLLIFAAFGYVLYRLARKIFSEETT